MLLQHKFVLWMGVGASSPFAPELTPVAESIATLIVQEVGEEEAAPPAAEGARSGAARHAGLHRLSSASESIEEGDEEGERKAPAADSSAGQEPTESDSLAGAVRGLHPLACMQRIAIWPLAGVAGTCMAPLSLLDA